MYNVCSSRNNGNIIWVIPNPQISHFFDLLYNRELLLGKWLQFNMYTSRDRLQGADIVFLIASVPSRFRTTQFFLISFPKLCTHIARFQIATLSTTLLITRKSSMPAVKVVLQQRRDVDHVPLHVRQSQDPVTTWFDIRKVISCN